MKGVGYIASRIIALFVLFGLAMLIHEYFIYPNILKKEGWLRELAEKKIDKNPDVIYFSASTNKALGPDDKDRRFIDRMIQDSITLHLESIDTGAIHAGIFHAVLERISKDKLPKMIVVDLNIRSFGANWIHSGLENSLQRNLVYWNDKPGVANHFLSSVKWYDYKSPVEHERAIEYAEKFAKLPFGGSHSTIKNWCDSLFKASKTPEEGMVMLRHFGFTIDEQNEQMKRFDKIVDWGINNGVQVVFVILPENIERMDLLVGKDLKELVRRNALFLERRYKGRVHGVINLWDRAGSEVFFESFPTEHYRSLGRQVVASEVSKLINRFKDHDHTGSTKNR
jgi:hypothetical protein